MKVILTFATSVNGKITNGNDPDVTKWSSKEDKDLYNSLLSEADVLIRTSKTYELSHHKLENPSYRQIVLTRDPEKYSDKKVEGKLEFTSESPSELIKRLEKEGHKNVLLAVGSTVASLFIKEKLITDFYLTIEPHIFGSGTPMFSDIDAESNLDLINVEKLNAKSTVLLKYKVL